MSDYDDLSIEVYSSGDTRLSDPDGLLSRAVVESFETVYPGGRYGAARLWVPRSSMTGWWHLKINQRVILRLGMEAVYEGWIDGFSHVLDAEQAGSVVHLIGGWARKLMRRRWWKRWSDNRLEDELWRWQTGASGAEKCSIDRRGRIRFTPKGVAWSNGDYAAVRYTMPTGETVKKITYDYALAEGGQAWEIAIRNVGTGADVVSVTASGTATSQSHTLATPSQSIELRFYARAGQTPSEDGTYYGEFSNLTVYSETSSINLSEAAADVAGYNTELSSGTAYIGACSQDLTPLFSDGESLADILTDAAGFGDGSGGRWAVGVLCSEAVPGGAGKPVLFAEAYPATTDYDLSLNLAGELGIEAAELGLEASEIANSITVEYQDDDGYTVVLTPADDSTLSDATSIAAWGQSDHRLSLGYSTAAVAPQNGRRWLAAFKDPQWTAERPIEIAGSIRRKSGDPLSAARVRAGMRLRIEDFLSDPLSSSGGLVMVITQTSYTPAGGGRVQMSFGKPPAPLLSLLEAPQRYTEEDDGGGMSGPYGSNSKHVYEHLGYTKAQWLALPEAERMRIKRDAQARKRRTGRFKGKDRPKRLRHDT